MKDALRSRLSGPRDRLRQYLMRRLHWLTSDTQNLLGEPASGFAWVVILGREHYDERSIRYPIRTRMDLNRVLRLELESPRQNLTYIGPYVDNHREVKIFSIKPEAESQLRRAVFVIPESLLLSLTIEPHTIVTVSRNAVRYFLSASTPSQMSGGLVRSADLYALGAGLSVGHQLELSDDTAFHERFVRSLKTLGAADWIGFVSSALTARVLDKSKPAAALLAIFVTAYLVLAQAYLTGMTMWREHQLSRLGSEVSTLIETQRRIDRTVEEHGAIARIMEGRWGTYRVWEIAGEVWNSGGSFTVVNMIGPKLTVRGSTVDATALLKKISALASVRSAKFIAPVRQDNFAQEFVIEIELKRGVKE